MRNGFGAATLVLACAIAVPAGPAAAETMDDESGEVLYASPDLRIIRTADRHGRVALLLTNIDEDGAHFPGRQAEPERPRAGPPPEAPLPAAAPAAPAATRVIIRRVGAMGAVEEEIEVAAPVEGATVIVLDGDRRGEEPRQAPAPPCPVVPIVVPWVVGGIPGAFRYPDRLPFLGYGPTNATPSMFGGLGLNAGNRFGLTGAAPCGEGFDCMFAPGTRRP